MIWLVIAGTVVAVTAVLEIILWVRVKRYIGTFETAVNEERRKMQLPVHHRQQGMLGAELANLQGIRNDLTELVHVEEEKWQSAVSKELMAEKIRFAQLQDQINPHFLYNTLENIRARAIIDDNLVIADMTESLSQYFRYNISKGADIVPLSEELNNIRLYMKIQRYRFGDRLSFHIENHGDPMFLDKCMIPKMTLQPIVENSIFHGIENKMGKGNVWVNTDNTEHLLELWVEDDGIGIPPEELEKMQERLQNDESNLEWIPRKKGEGVAIQNVNNRLKLLYGKEYGLNISSTQGVGTEVRILIPLITRKE